MGEDGGQLGNTSRAIRPVITELNLVRESRMKCNVPVTGCWPGYASGGHFEDMIRL
jgi:hypothetical protein